MGKQLRSLVIMLCLLLALAAAAMAGGVKSTTYYNLHYGDWEGVANAMAPYLDAAFTTPRDFLGYDNQGFAKIEVFFYSDPKSFTDGYTYEGANAIWLNLRQGGSTADAYLRLYGSTLAHETGHVLFFHKTHSPYQDTHWYTEALSYYLGEVAYPYGPQLSKAALGATFSLYSKDGAVRSSWFASGVRYMLSQETALDLSQLMTIGKFLVDFGGGDAVKNTLTYLAQNPRNLEEALYRAYNKNSGQFDTNSGADVNTLYSNYINYYLGHY